jgi:hypothetical protein
MFSRFSTALIVATALSLAGCFDDTDRNDLTGNNPDNPQDPDPPPAANRAPTISGTPTPTIVEGEFYEFLPNAADADGDSLEFSIARKPRWATFDRATGRLAGTPDADDVGSFTNISISVSDGEASASLSNFDITVDAFALGTATLSWNPPTENVDGSALIDLSGYRIYYGRNQNQLTRTIVINNAGLTRYVVENLGPANWYFSMTSINANGVESRRSAPVSKTIS